MATANTSDPHSLFLNVVEDLKKLIAKKYGKDLVIPIFEGIALDYIQSTKPQHIVQLNTAESKVKTLQDQLANSAVTIRNLQQMLADERDEINQLRSRIAALSAQSSAPAVTSRDLHKDLKNITPFAGIEFEDQSASAAVDLLRFINEFESVVGNLNITEENKLHFFRLKLTNEAKLVANRFQPQSYDDLVDILKDRYLDKQTQGKKLKMLIDKATLKAKEPIINFGYRLLDLSNALMTVRGHDMAKSDLFEALSASFLRPFDKSIDKNFKVAMALDSQCFTDLIHAVDKCIDKDQTLRTKQVDHVLPLTKAERKEPLYKCFRCSRLGHMARDCPNRGSQKPQAPQPQKFKYQSNFPKSK